MFSQRRVQQATRSMRTCVLFAVIIIIIIIVGFIERTYLTKTTTPGPLQHIVTPTDMVKPLTTQLPGNAYKEYCHWRKTLSILYLLAVHEPGTHFKYI